MLVLGLRGSMLSPPTSPLTCGAERREEEKGEEPKRDGHGWAQKGIVGTCGELIMDGGNHRARV